VKSPVVLVVCVSLTSNRDLSDTRIPARPCCRTFQGTDSGGHGIVEDHAPVAGIAFWAISEDEVLLPRRIEEPGADPQPTHLPEMSSRWRMVRAGAGLTGAGSQRRAGAGREAANTDTGAGDVP